MLFFSRFKESIVGGLIALIIFFPITGMLIKNWTIEYRIIVPFILATIVFCGRFLVTIALENPAINSIIKKKFIQNENIIVIEENKRKNFFFFILLFLCCLILPFFSNKYFISIYILCMIYIVLGLGLNIVLGFAGLLDLGFIAFYAVGAYSLGLMSQYWGLGFWTVLPLSAIIAGITGVILGFPVLRMHGDYLAIVTLGFGEIIRLVLNNWTSFTGGPNGLQIPALHIFGLSIKRRSKSETFFEFFDIPYNSIYKEIFLYILLLLVISAILFFIGRLQKMPLGRAWEGLRENEIACRSLGINHVLVKLSAFAIGAAIAGMAGVFFATWQGFINPNSFTFFESALVVAIVVLGGLGSVRGVIIAAIIFTLMHEVFRAFADFRILIFGIIMVVMMIWKPRGLAQIRRIKYHNPLTKKPSPYSEV